MRGQPAGLLALGVADPDLTLVGIPKQRRRRALGDDLAAIARKPVAQDAEIAVRDARFLPARDGDVPQMALFVVFVVLKDVRLGRGGRALLDAFRFLGKEDRSWHRPGTIRSQKLQ